MTTVEGQIHVGEANAACGRIRKSQIGLPWYLIGVLLIPIFAIAGGFAEEGVRSALGRPVAQSALGDLIGLVIGGWLYLNLCRRLSVAQFRKQLHARGLPLDMPSRFELTPEQLVHTGHGMTTSADWSGVTELFRVKGYWIFMAVSLPFVVPERFFADRRSEREFIAEALSRMSPEARARSADASKFLEAA